MKRIILFLAQGFGLGKIPFAPGTFGSLAGLAWFAGLLAVSSATYFFWGLIVAIGFSIVVTGAAENALGQKDPSSFVLDEIVAVPACFIGWLVILARHKDHWPAFGSFFDSQHWPATLGVVTAFRIFDILKPWPVWQAQSLLGGWGVTMDDLLAALYVNLVFFAAYSLKPVLFL